MTLNQLRKINIDTGWRWEEMNLNPNVKAKRGNGQRALCDSFAVIPGISRPGLQLALSLLSHPSQ